LKDTVSVKQDYRFLSSKFLSKNQSQNFQFILQYSTWTSSNFSSPFSWFVVAFLWLHKFHIFKKSNFNGLFKVQLWQQFKLQHQMLVSCDRH